MAKSLAEARSYETAIEIIPADACKSGIAFLKETLTQNHPNPETTVLIPIMRGGSQIGKALQRTLEYPYAPMRMSFYDRNNKRLDQPICITPPNALILTGKTSVVFAEAVVDSGRTTQGATEVVRSIVSGQPRQPTVETYTLVVKTPSPSIIPQGVTAAYWVHSDIWVAGNGCDAGQLGRERKNIVGYVSPFAQETPRGPYVVQLFPAMTK